MNNPHNSVSTHDELAQRLGVSPRSIGYYLAAGMRDACAIPEGYHVAKAQAWVADNVATRKPVDDSSDLGSLKRAKLVAEVRKLEAESNRKELENARLAGALLDSADVHRQVATILLRIKSRLEQLPDDLQLLFGDEDRVRVRSEADTFIHSLLTEMSGWEVNTDAK